jgi:CO/xanthine dehydrogenase Mo-binding subunit
MRNLTMIDRTVFADVRGEDLHVVGTTAERADARSHVTGRTQYFEDVSFPGMLHLKMVRSTRHHALLKGIDASALESAPGFVRLITYKDVPNNWYNVLRLLGVQPDDEPALAEDRVLYVGEPICAVVAQTPGAAADAVAKVRVDYEDLPAVLDVEEAIKPGAPVINPRHGHNFFVYEGHHCRRIRFGDVEKGFAQADHILERRYDSSPIEHAATEVTGCIAKPEGNGRYTIYTNTQALFFTLDNTALILGVPPNRLRLVGGTVGGAFGGKVDVIVEPLATLAAMLTNRPVKYAFSRAEEMQVSSTRGAERIYMKDGFMRDGRIVARKVTLYLDAGAYSRLSPYGVTKAAGHIQGPYAIPNVWVDAHCVYTNRTPSSAMRGFGVTIGDFALESQMDEIARVLGMNPFELRLLNAYRDGDMRAYRKRVEDAALVEVVQKAAQLVGERLPPRFAAMRSTNREGLGDG